MVPWACQEWLLRAGPGVNLSIDGCDPKTNKKRSFSIFSWVLRVGVKYNLKLVFGALFYIAGIWVPVLCFTSLLVLITALGNCDNGFILIGRTGLRCTFCFLGICSQFMLDLYSQADVKLSDTSKPKRTVVICVLVHAQICCVYGKTFWEEKLRDLSISALTFPLGSLTSGMWFSLFFFDGSSRCMYDPSVFLNFEADVMHSWIELFAK